VPGNRGKVVSSRKIFDGPIFGVRRDEVIEPGGIRATRDVVTHAGSVVLLPVLDDGRILLVRQYRHAVGASLWELVAGRIDPGESPLAAARRELLEETGYTARSFQRLFEAFPTPGFVGERFVLYLARGLRPGTARPEADERVVPRAFPLRLLLQRIRRGVLRDGKTIAGILYYARFLR